MKRFKLKEGEGVNYANFKEGVVYFEGSRGEDGQAPRPIDHYIQQAPHHWQEVIYLEAPAPPHKDTDLGHFTGLILASMVGNSHNAYVKLDCDVMTKAAILAAEELIKRLDEKTKKS